MTVTVSELSQLIVAILYTAFLSHPPLGDLETTYHIHIGLIGKHVLDFLLELIEGLSPMRTQQKTIESVQLPPMPRSLRHVVASFNLRAVFCIGQMGTRDSLLGLLGQKPWTGRKMVA